MAEIILLDACAQGLYGITGERFASQYHFQSVVIRGIVAAGNHDCRMRVQMISCKINHRRGNTPNINDVDAALLNAARQSGGKFHARQTSVATNCDRVLAACCGF